jgi:hypothetical protein
MRACVLHTLPQVPPPDARPAFGFTANRGASIEIACFHWHNELPKAYQSHHTNGDHAKFSPMEHA